MRLDYFVDLRHDAKPSGATDARLAGIVNDALAGVIGEETAPVIERLEGAASAKG